MRAGAGAARGSARGRGGDRLLSGRFRHLAQATRLVRLSEAQGFPFWTGPGTMLAGWAMADQGHATERAQHLRNGLAMRRPWGRHAPESSSMTMTYYNKLGKRQ